MTGPAPRDDMDDEKPLDPAVENVRRKMVRFFAINIGILLFALMAVLVAIVYKAGRDKPDTAAVNSAVPGEPSAPVDLVLNAGETVASQSLSGDRLSVAVASGGTIRRIVILDLRSGKVAGEVSVSLRQ